MSKDQRLWGGRFEEGISEICQDISESISFDRILYAFDIQASLIHVKMLEKQKIITTDVYEKISRGLRQIQKEIESDKMNYRPDLEDIHTHIEKRLIEIVGEEGKSLHTGRSRNDQVATDTHLFLKHHIKTQIVYLKELLGQMFELAQKNKQTIWAGYTHLQIAQPVLLGHYLMAYFWMFERDLHLLEFSLCETDCSPLGAAAIGGANYPIDREFSAEELGFKKVYANSMDAVSNRDYQMSYHFFAARLFIHISRFCEDMILYNSVEFSYVQLGDKVTTGSSIMPQKKNPDIAELLRGKTARVIGDLQMLLINMKGLPMAYNRDLQEDKIYLFDSIRQVTLGIKGVGEILNNITFKPEKVRDNLLRGFSQATDIADYLVSNYKIPFRRAHEMTGQIVLYCESKKITLDQLEPGNVTEVWGDGYELSEDLLKLESCIVRKMGTGSTSYIELDKQLEAASKIIEKFS
ncbi:MAG: argininosuccinate lyase [Spirochaetia bacterium]|nr:argininosuccinate lyase [Spirochaetia bacterium]